MWEASPVGLPPCNNKTLNPSQFLIGFQSIAEELSIAEKPQTVTEGEGKAEALLNAAGEAQHGAELTAKSSSSKLSPHGWRERGRSSPGSSAVARTGLGGGWLLVSALLPCPQDLSALVC